MLCFKYLGFDLSGSCNIHIRPKRFTWRVAAVGLIRELTASASTDRDQEIRLGSI
jgi:hypothetical protein